MSKAFRPGRSYNPMTKPITEMEYGGLQRAFDFFKEHLFDERRMPDVLITYQRRAHSRGFFGADRFAGRDASRHINRPQHEIALNPDGFIGRSDQEILSTLVHEMVHLWQQERGTAPKRAYHNKEFAAKMKEVGLYPSNTGAVGGRETGAHMTHYILPDGPFTQAYEQLLAKGWRLNLESAVRPNNTEARKNKTKFTCPSCGQNAWGKPDLAVTCTPCGIPMSCSYDTNTADLAA